MPRIVLNIPRKDVYDFLQNAGIQTATIDINNSSFAKRRREVRSKAARYPPGSSGRQVAHGRSLLAAQNEGEHESPIGLRQMLSAAYRMPERQSGVVADQLLANRSNPSPRRTHSRV